VRECTSPVGNNQAVYRGTLPRMLMVIFGAGASFDSSPTYEVGTAAPRGDANDAYNDYYRPPLAKDLFANRPLFIRAIDAFPQCKTIVSRLRDPMVLSGQVSVEALLQQIESEAGTYPRGHRELFAVQCYLQHALTECQNRWAEVTRGITNYLSLLREIERTHSGNQPVCLVTFNYDTILEDALRELGYGINQLEDYADGPSLFRVFKLHGSINWAQRVSNPLPDAANLRDVRSILRCLIEEGAYLQISDRFVMCAPDKMGVVDRKPVFPAIAIPVEKKNKFACPASHLDRLTDMLPDVSKILVIGWRATEAHFLALLKEHIRPGVRLSVVAGGPADAEQTRNRIRDTLGDKGLLDSFANGAGFTHFVRSGNAVAFLQR